MGFELREHTADVAVEATAPDLSTLFGHVADGLAAASCDDIPEASPDAQTFEVAVAAENREALLFDYLDELIYERDVRSVLPVDNEVHVEPPTGGAPDDSDGGSDETDGGAADVDTATGSEWRLTGTYRGLPLADVDARDVKAVTYSEMRVERVDGEWVAYVVFDV
ncbi:MAG: archease [Haloquadratum sp.]